MGKAREFFKSLSASETYEAMRKAVNSGDQETATTLGAELGKEVERFGVEAVCNIYEGATGRSLNLGPSGQPLDLTTRLRTLRYSAAISEQVSVFREALHRQARKYTPALYWFMVERI